MWQTTRLIILFYILRVHASRNLRRLQVDPYEILTSEQIFNQVKKFQSHYPDFLSVTTSQEEYNLPAAGDESDCTFEEDPGCSNLILTIQDFEKHPPGSESSNRLPEVFWSGEVHGNERVGPTAVVEAAHLLLDAASCIAKPRLEIKRNGEDSKEWRQEVQKAKECRQEFKDVFDIEEYEIQWLARLVSTRRLIIVPTANALGYSRSKREEGDIDPNRDFPFDPSSPSECMQTIAGRTINELYRDHLFQLSLTFHGGTEVIGYEWGAYPFESYDSPDDKAQSDIASAYKYHAGGFPAVGNHKRTPPYKTGAMNPLVYPVHGGMEDWAYAGSWIPKYVPQCTPDTFGGYPPEKTTYDDSTLRAFNMLIETSDDKIPAPETLGSPDQILKNDGRGNGHIARNVRLAIMASELVEPYVAIRSVNELDLSEDIIPNRLNTNEECKASNHVEVQAKSRKMTFRWVVGGAISVDDTKVWYGKWSDMGYAFDCSLQPSIEDVRSKLKEGTPISATKGNGAMAPDQQGLRFFSASIDISGYAPGDELILFASARVDSGWTVVPVENVKPNVPPQSHVVNARTNPDWYHEKNGKVIQGRLDWFSMPLAVTLTDSDSPEVIEVSARLVSSTPSTSPSSGLPGDGESGGSGFFTFFVVLVGIAGVGLGGRQYLRHKMRSTNRSRVREFIEDETAPTPGLRKKVKGRSRGQYDDVPDNGELELGEYS